MEGEKMTVMSEFITLKELCNEISVSVATGKNWIKLGKIIPEYIENKTPFFSKNYVRNLKKEIESGENGVLKSRRNKKYVSGRNLYHSYVSNLSVNFEVIQNIIDIIVGMEIPLTEKQIPLLIAECAVQLIIQREGITCEEEQNFLFAFLEGKLCLGGYQRLIEDLIEDSDSAVKFILQYPQLFRVRYIYEEKEDILGLLYISSKNLGSRKATGSYYTPTSVVKKLVNKLFEKNFDFSNKKILDPCCGTGNFLLQLPDTLTMDQIYGNDIDETGVKITRINLALKYHTCDMQLLYQNITKSNYYTSYKNEKFDYIIGNPP